VSVAAAAIRLRRPQPAVVDAESTRCGIERPYWSPGETGALAWHRAGVRARATRSRSHTARARCGGLFGVRCDVTSAEDVEAHSRGRGQHAGRVLVANAGITRDSLLLRMTTRTSRTCCRPTWSGRSGSPARDQWGMLRLKRGRNRLISSVVGPVRSAGRPTTRLQGRAGRVARSSPRDRLARHTCNVVAPGFVATDMTRCCLDDRKRRSGSRCRSTATPRRRRSRAW